MKLSKKQLETKCEELKAELDVVKANGVDALKMLLQERAEHEIALAKLRDELYFANLQLSAEREYGDM